MDVVGRLLIVTVAFFAFFAIAVSAWQIIASYLRANVDTASDTVSSMLGFASVQFSVDTIEAYRVNEMNMQLARVLSMLLW